MAEADGPGHNNGSEPQQDQDSGSLVDKIKAHARAGAFAQADALREELIRREPLALDKILSVGNYIEEQKTAQFDRDHLAMWQELYATLSDEEKNCLFYSLKAATIEPGKLLVGQHRLNQRLFFIEQGRLSIFFTKEGKNVPVTQLSRGDIIGEDSFFGISLCTLSAVTQTEVKLRHLSRKDLLKWQDEHPGLDQKLADFCRTASRAEAALQTNSLDRRHQTRYRVAGSVTAHVLDKAGNRTKAYFKGGLFDISRTGICFSMKASKEETARALLGRYLDLAVVFDAQPEHPLQVVGQIVKVSYFYHNDYNVHVVLREPFSRAQFKSFPCQWDSSEQ